MQFFEKNSAIVGTFLFILGPIRRDPFQFERRTF